MSGLRNAFVLSGRQCWKIGRLTSEEVILQLELIVSKCMPMLLFGLEACTLNKSQWSSLDFTINIFFLWNCFRPIALKLCEPLKRVSVLKFPLFCLKKNGKSIDVFSGVKFIFIICEKKLILLISLYMHYNWCTVFKPIYIYIRLLHRFVYCIAFSISLPFIGE